MEQQIFEEESDADHFYLIRAGRVVLETFVPGTGVITIPTDRVRRSAGLVMAVPTVSVAFQRAIHRQTHAVAFDARAIRQTAEEDHDFGYDITMRVGQILLQRLQATRMQLLDFYAPPA